MTETTPAWKPMGIAGLTNAATNAMCWNSWEEATRLTKRIAEKILKEQAEEPTMNYKQARARVFVLVTTYVLEHGANVEDGPFSQLTTDIHLETGFAPKLYPLTEMVVNADAINRLDHNQFDIDVDVTDPTYAAHKLDWIDYFRQLMNVSCADIFPTYFVLSKKQ